MDNNTQETNKLLYKLIDSSDVLVLYLEVNGNIALCNKKIEEITGMPKSEIIGQSCLSVLFHDDKTTIKQQMFKAVLDDTLSYKRLNTFDGVITNYNNNERYISWNISPILSESKEIDGALLIGVDTTDLKEAEASVKKIDETLKNIFYNIKEYALYVINLDGNITYYGMGSEVMFGWQKDEIIIKHVSILHTKEDAASKFPFILEQTRQAGQYEMEIELVKKDGQAFPVMLTVNEFLDKEGHLIGYIFMAKDITERKRLEYQVFQAEKLATIGKLAAGVAHEINNPLFVISGRLEMILEEKGLNSNLKSDLEIISTQTERIRRVADQLLKFSRKTPPKLEAVNLNNVIETALSFLAYHKLPVSRVEIEKDLAEGLPCVKGDLNQLQEVFVNLFINALQSMPEGGKFSIKTSSSPDHYAQIRISDTGCGIGPENLKNIFMPFFSTKKDGTGLGLSICYNIIKSHNGSVDIETKINKGTTFIIKLPFA